jgi:hypothetical protein
LLETEPWDEALDRRIWALSEERIAWDKTLADRRRRAPIEVQRLMEDLVTRQQQAEYVPPESEDSDAMVLDLPRRWPSSHISALPTLNRGILQPLAAPIQRHEEIKKTHAETVDHLKSMDQVHALPHHKPSTCPLKCFHRPFLNFYQKLSVQELWRPRLQTLVHSLSSPYRVVFLHIYHSSYSDQVIDFHCAQHTVIATDLSFPTRVIYAN